MEKALLVRRMVVGAMMLLLVAGVRAEELEYRYELGAMVGGSSYYGDANYSSPFNNVNIMGGAIWRYNINPRMAVKSNLSVARISGSTVGGENSFPGGDTDFSRTLLELGAQYELHFFAYGNGEGYKGTRRLAPYIFAGAGVVYAPAPAKHVVTANIPLGVGLKFKVAPRLNLGCEISYRFTFSDNLDVVNEGQLSLNDPYGIESGFMKNKDSYSFLSFSLTYDLSPKYRKCNN
ncbi:MAG: outer membrane beta-barrel protein [Bacteroidaceae bacterium]|nr:outer membrane beta-barrel protein [Bacteroidaceae bacterium]